MIQTSSIIYIIISCLICFGFPIICSILLNRGRNGLMGAFIAGGLSFYLTQMLIRIPLLQLAMPKLDWYQTLSTNAAAGQAFGLALFLGLTAALFETAGRSLTMNFLIKKRLSYKAGLMHGLGHGGIEAILLVGINYLFFTVYAILRNQGINEPLLWAIPSEQQDLMKSILLDTPSSTFLLAGIERGLTMLFHMAMSLLITVGIIKRQQLKYTAAVIMLHTLLDFGAVMLSSKVANIWIIELLVVFAALISVAIIVFYKGKIVNVIKKDPAESAVDEGY